MQNLASTYANKGMWKDAVELQSEVVRVRKKNPGSAHPSTMTGMHYLGSIYANQGQWAEAEKMFKEVFHARLAGLSNNEYNAATMTSGIHLAIVYAHQNQWESAKDLLEELVQDWKKKVGAGDKTSCFLASKSYLEIANIRLGLRDHQKNHPANPSLPPPPPPLLQLPQGNWRYSRKGIGVVFDKTMNLS